MSNFRLHSSKKNSWPLPRPVHVSSVLPHLRKWHHSHPFTYPNRKPRGYPLFLIFPPIQSISEPWFYFQNMSQTSPCSSILATILVAIITMETYLTSLFSLLSTYPPSVFHEAALSELLKPTNQGTCFSGAHYTWNTARTTDYSPQSSPHSGSFQPFISFHTILLSSILLSIPQTLQAYLYFACVLSFKVAFLSVDHSRYLCLSFNVHPQNGDP